MRDHPRNVRCRQPRPVVPVRTSSGSSDDEVGSAALRRAYRFGMTATPTPPPVTLTLGPDGLVLGADEEQGPDGAAPDSHPSRRGSRRGSAVSSHRRRPRSRWWLWATLIVLALLSIIAWRALMGTPLAALTRWSALHLGGAEQVQASALLARRPHRRPYHPPPMGPGAVKHEGYVPIDGGVLIAPTSFTAAPDGSYDLLIHFHGDVGVVRESVEHVGLNAILAIVNQGVMSGVYRDAYSGPSLYDNLLDEIHRAVAARGVRHPRRRRVALSAWSAGYAAIGAIVRNRPDDDQLDAVLVFDGIHAGWRKEAPNKMNPRPLEAFVVLAQRAVRGDLLFSITHSEIEPPSFAGSRQTAAYLLKAVGARPATDVMLELPPHLKLRAAEHAVAKRKEKRMIPYSDTRVGQLHVRGFRGDTREHHMAHLLQMGATALPELAERWGQSAP
jgi:hypothetical protein